jgi:regulator of protease activity HflC (stomatin/prohibitin superfamily)
MLLAIVPSLAFLAVVFLMTGIHKIEEGHVGVYYTRGILSTSTTDPGYNFYFPLLTRYEMVQVTVQTDQVIEIPCGTSGGVMIYFDKIEVVNRLDKNHVYETVKNYTKEYDKIWIYDKIHHEINQFCSKHTLHEVFIEKFESLDEDLIQVLQKDLKEWVPGLEILSIRVTKPRIPAKIKTTFEAMEAEKTRYLIVNEHQKVKKQEAETKKRQAIIKAQSELDVTRINMGKKLKEKENELKIAKIENEMYLDREKSKVDAEHYKNLKELETSKEKLTPEYIRYESIKSLTNNLIINIGSQVPMVRFVHSDTRTHTTPEVLETLPQENKA